MPYGYCGGKPSHDQKPVAIGHSIIRRSHFLWELGLSSSPMKWLNFGSSHRVTEKFSSLNSLSKTIKRERFCDTNQIYRLYFIGSYIQYTSRLLFSKKTHNASQQMIRSRSSFEGSVMVWRLLSRASQLFHQLMILPGHIPSPWRGRICRLIASISFLIEK